MTLFEVMASVGAEPMGQIRGHHVVGVRNKVVRAGLINGVSPDWKTAKIRTLFQDILKDPSFVVQRAEKPVLVCLDFDQLEATASRHKSGEPSMQLSAEATAAATWIPAGPGDDDECAGQRDLSRMVAWASMGQDIGLDCEFAQTGTLATTQLCLVQVDVATEHGARAVFVIDLVQASADLLAEIKREMGKLLRRESLVKVFHGGAEDIRLLRNHFEVDNMPNVLDVQLLQQLQQASNSNPTPQQMGLGPLLQLYGYQHATKAMVHSILDHNSALFLKRPLPDYLKAYVMDDVRFLVNVAKKQLKVQSLALNDDSDGQTVRLAIDLCASIPELTQPIEASALTTSQLRQRIFSTDSVVDPQSAIGQVCQLGFTPDNHPLLMPLDAAAEVTAGGLSEADTAAQHEATGDAFADSLLEALPPRIHAELKQRVADAAAAEGGSGIAWHGLIEIAVDQGRDLALRFRSGRRLVVPGLQVPTTEAIATLKQVQQRMLADFGYSSGSEIDVYPQFPLSSEDTSGWIPGADATLFTSDGRLGLPGTLHRISRGTPDRHGRVYNVTYRVGRHVPGIARIFTDLLADICRPADGASDLPGMLVCHSLLLLGPPGSGKTTVLRDIARVLADTFQQAVNVVDTSNEIAGDYVRPHECIGNARRFMVPDRKRQHEVLVEVVQNHTPQVIVVDEIGTAQEVRAMRDISQRGVIAVGTAHGISLIDLINNPQLSDLVGGVENVALGDKLAQKTGSTDRKTRTERARLPTFTMLVEVLDENRWRVHRNVAGSVDMLLEKQNKSPHRAQKEGADVVPEELPGTELRTYAPDGRMLITLH